MTDGRARPAPAGALAAFWSVVSVWLVLLAAAGGTATAVAGGPRSAAMVVEASTGRVLYAENADTPVYPASLTKMMTLYLTFDALERGRLRLDQKLPVSAHAASRPPTKLGVRAGGHIRVEDAILGLVTRSANDAAAVLAEALAGSEAAFARQMTARARQLGMRSTVFRNASGLPDPQQITTATDMALLGRALIYHYPKYYSYFSRRQFSWNGTVYRNHNHLLKEYSGADGIKTGYIRASGFNLVASVERDGRRLIAVVFGGSSAAARDRHMMGLLDRSFAQLDDAPRYAAATPQPKPAANTILAALERTAAATAHAVAAPKAEDLGASLAPPASAGALAAAEGAHLPPLAPRIPTAMPGGWGIQVGAFSHADRAERQLARVGQTLTEILSVGTARVIPITGGEQMIYRARFSGLSEADARRACAELLPAQIVCMLVPPGPQLALSGN